MTASQTRYGAARRMKELGTGRCCRLNKQSLFATVACYLLACMAFALLLAFPCHVNVPLLFVCSLLLASPPGP